MPFSSQLERVLRKGTFPLTSSAGLVLWKELVAALEANFAVTIAEIKKIYGHEDDGSFFSRYVADIQITADDAHAFLGTAHERLTQDHGRVARGGDVHSLVMRIRALAESHNLVSASDVALLPAHADHGMGTGLVTTDTLTFIPDPAHPLVNNYGSTPDQSVIENLAPAWGILKKRRHVSATTGAIGRKPHYVLAHLINHNVNGSGATATNVVPFSADGNTKMAKEVESDLKDFVQRGAPVKYDIEVGPGVGMTPGRTAALNDCTTAAQREVVEMEQHLPAWLKITLQACDTHGTWHMIHNKVQIDNFVPETVPVI